MALIRLTDEIAKRIVAAIRAGSYPHVAAQSAGVPRALFGRWLERGRQQRCGRYRVFLLQVREAKAQARAKAEIDARQKDAKFWLRYGPGKEISDAPGWMSGKSSRSKRSGTANLDATLMDLLAILSRALIPFAEARTAVLAILDANHDSGKTNSQG